jgi:hypothetical protein
MEVIHRRLTIAIARLSFLMLAFSCNSISSLAQTISERTAVTISKMDGAVVDEFQKAWLLSGNGFEQTEALILLYQMRDGSISARSCGRSGLPQQFSFAWTAAISAVVHTHPNRTDPKPSGQDLRLADRFAIPVFTITLRGMYVYDPGTRKISIVLDGLDWLDPSKWNIQRQGVAMK